MSDLGCWAAERLAALEKAKTCCCSDMAMLLVHVNGRAVSSSDSRSDGGLCVQEVLEKNAVVKEMNKGLTTCTHTYSCRSHHKNSANNYIHSEFRDASLHSDHI